MRQSALWTPLSESGCVLWLSDNSNFVALAQPTVASPTDLSNAAWTKTRSTATHGQTDPDGGTSADLIKEDATAGATHIVTQTFGAFVASIPAVVTVSLKAKERSWWRIQLGGASAYVNSSTGAIGTLSGATVAVTTLASGFYDFAVTVANPSSGAFTLGLATADGTDSYNGDNTSGAYAYNARCTQDRVSQWSDRSTAGNHVSQATAANQPRWIQAQQNGHPIQRFDGTNDSLASATITVIPQPSTLFVACKMLSGPAVYEGVVDGKTISNRNCLLFDYTNGLLAMYAGTVQGIAQSFTNPMVVAIEFNGASSKLYRDGNLLLTANAGAQGTDGWTIGTFYDLSAPSNVDVYEVVHYNGLLGAGRSRVTQALGAKWGIAVTP